MDITHILEKSMQDHDHLCPRQILGVRLGLAGMHALGFNEPPMKKQLLIISETDGCFVDGVSAATGCTVGHRTLRVEDYGKVAATFVDIKTSRAMRVAPRLDIRERACAFEKHEPRHYYAQMQSYQTMPEEEMFTVQEVVLNSPVEKIISHPGLRVHCDMCGEEIMNERETVNNDLTLCRTCVEGGYYQPISQDSLLVHQAIPAYTN